MSGFWWHHGPLGAGGARGDLLPTFKVFCKAAQSCLAVRDGALVLVPPDRADEHQHWFKDARLSFRIKDKEGRPVFSLVNKATGLALQHPLGPHRPVRLLMFNPDYLDESVLWTENGHLGRDFGCIRMLHNVRFVLDARTFRLPEWVRCDSQSWKILHWNDEANMTLAGLEAEPTCRIYCKVDRGYSVTICGGTVCLAPTDPNNAYQHWIQDKRPGKVIKNEDGYPVFALVNRATGDAIRGSLGHGRPIKLVPYNPFYLDVSVLWTMSWDMGHGFRCIHLVDNISLNFGAFHGDSTKIVLSNWHSGDGLQWQIVPWCRVVEELKSHKEEELVSKGSEVEDGQKEQGAAEKMDGTELLPLDMLKL